MGTSVALVGSCGQQDNLALGYLAGYAEHRGHVAHIIPFNHPKEVTRCVNDILAMNPAVVGLGISFQFAISDYLELATKLREKGYRGHITCGGHVPTFCYRDLLRESDAIDTAVRHEGEETLAQMLDAVDRRQPVADIPGLVWRENNEIIVGPPRPFVKDLDSLPWPKRSPIPHRVAGFAVSFVISSRGCVGDCAYCVIRAFSKDAGGPVFRMREVQHVADEIAHLRRTHNARLVMMQDDLFILPSVKKSISRMDALRDALNERGVDDLQFWIKARPETIRRPLLDAARRLGVGQVFLGIEQVTEPRLQYLGRSHSPQDNRNALNLLTEYGIQPCFNLMMFDPECTISQVDAAIAFAKEFAHIPWNICRTEMYPGTAIHERLRQSGRLEGDFIHIGYTMTDTAAEMMFRIVRVAFYHRSFNIDSLLNQLATLLFTLEAIHRLHPKNGESRELLRGRQLLKIINEDTAHRLQQASDFAKTASKANAKSVQDFAVRLAMDMNEADHLWQLEITQLFEQVHTFSTFAVR